MFARIAKKNKTAFLILLAITILLSFLCWDDEKVQGTRFGATEEVSFLIEKPSEDVKIQIVDEINSVVFHAVIIRRISSRQILRILRFYLIPILAAAIAISIYLVAYCLKPSSFQYRTVLVQYIHKSDGKK